MLKEKVMMQLPYLQKLICGTKNMFLCYVASICTVL